MTTQSESLLRSPGLRALAAVTLCALLLAGCSSAGSQEQVQVQAPPPVSPEVIAVAEKAIGEGRYSDAKQLPERALPSERGKPRARMPIAAIHIDMRNLEPAEQTFASIVALPDTAARQVTSGRPRLPAKGQE